MTVIVTYTSTICRPYGKFALGIIIVARRFIYSICFIILAGSIFFAPSGSPSASRDTEEALTWPRCRWWRCCRHRARSGKYVHRRFRRFWGGSYPSVRKQAVTLSLDTPNVPAKECCPDFTMTIRQEWICTASAWYNRILRKKKGVHAWEVKNEEEAEAGMLWWSEARNTLETELRQY